MIKPFLDPESRRSARVAKQIAGETVAQVASVSAPPTDAAKPTAAEQRSQNAYARRQARYKEAARLKTAGEAAEKPP